MEGKGIDSARSGRKRTQVGTTNRSTPSLSPKVPASAAVVASQGEDQGRTTINTSRGGTGSGVLRPRPASSRDVSVLSGSALLPSSPGQNFVSDVVSRGGENGVAHATCTGEKKILLQTLASSLRCKSILRAARAARLQQNTPAASLHMHVRSAVSSGAIAPMIVCAVELSCFPVCEARRWGRGGECCLMRHAESCVPFLTSVWYLHTQIPLGMWVDACPLESLEGTPGLRPT